MAGPLKPVARDAGIASTLSTGPWSAIATGVLGLFAASGVALFSEAPAFAVDHAPDQSFEQAFAPFELTEADASIAPDSALTVQERFDDAPVGSRETSGAGASLGSGNASYYGAGFAGRPTASGERFNPAGLTAAHRTLPFGTRVKVTNPRNGRSVVVRINDRGPFHGNRMIDLSQEAARQIGLIQQGHGPVRLSAVTS